MKLLIVTQDFAGRPIARLQWDKEGIFFADPEPAVNSMLTLELPGLRSKGADAVRDWLVERHKRPELVEGVWRKAVLEDLLDATNASDVAWYLSHHFTLAELLDFLGKHGPALHAEVRSALEAKKPHPALRKVQKRAERIVPAVNAASQRIQKEAHELELRDDRAKVAKLGAFDAKTWIEIAASLHHDEVKREVLQQIGVQLVATKGDVPAALDRMLENKLDRVWAPELWTAIANHVTLAANITGEAIDMTKAREVTVPLTWDAWKAGRVGTVKFLRSALVVTSGHRTIYVRGQRKLLHAIRSRGGSLARYGNTLVIGGRGGPASAHAKLLEVERIDTLANVDPRSAAHLAGELPPSDPITVALGHAHTDPKWRRILADLLVERLVGIDADVARRLARAQAGANRRRR